MTDLDKLREKAQAATPGPWHSPRFNVVDLASPRREHDPYLVVYGDPSYHNHAADTRYVAAADPTTILDLIDRCQCAETALREIENDDPPDDEDRWVTTVRLMQMARTALEGGPDAQ
jgi:hypothetical protein